VTGPLVLSTLLGALLLLGARVWVHEMQGLPPRRNLVVLDSAIAVLVLLFAVAVAIRFISLA